MVVMIKIPRNYKESESERLRRLEVSKAMKTKKVEDKKKYTRKKKHKGE
jgi:hypothetical protein